MKNQTLSTQTKVKTGPPMDSPMTPTLTRQPEYDDGEITKPIYACYL